jgi:PAS domain-containing protein
MTSLRKLLQIAIGIAVLAIVVLLAVVWRGIGLNIDASRHEHEVTQPAVQAMLLARFNVVQIQQFLTDVSATADEAGYDEAKVQLDAARKNLQTVATLQPDLGADVRTIVTDVERFHGVGLSMAQAYVSKGREAGNAVMKAKDVGFDDTAKALTERLDALESSIAERAASAAAAADAASLSSRNLSVAIGGLIALLMMAGGVIGMRLLFRLLGGEPVQAVEIANRVANNELDFPIDTVPGDQTSLIFTLKRMQQNLREQIARDRAISDENMRVKIALDNVSTGVMIADRARNIIYCNDAVKRVLKDAEDDLRKVLPNFNADNLVGQNIDQFHKNPKHQADLLGGAEQNLRRKFANRSPSHASDRKPRTIRRRGANRLSGRMDGSHRRSGVPA